MLIKCIEDNPKIMQFYCISIVELLLLFVIGEINEKMTVASFDNYVTRRHVPTYKDLSSSIEVTLLIVLRGRLHMHGLK